MAPYLYGNKWVTVKDIYKYGLIYCGLFLLSAIPVYLIASYII